MMRMLLCTTGLLLALLSQAGVAKPANVLFILADDLGHADINNSHTPHLSSLARKGVRFSRHYTEPICGPSRAEFLTGRYASEIGFESPSRGLSPGTETMATVMERAGYATHFLGKWHLSLDLQSAGPAAAGFQNSFAFVNQWMLQSTDEPKKPGYVDPFLNDGQSPPQRHSGHLTDILSQRAMEIMSGDKPWFIQLSYFAVHHPVEASAAYKRDGDSEYTALLRQLDTNVGKMLQLLEDSGQLEDTLIIFASDNGAKEPASNRPYPGGKGTYEEGGIRTPLVFHWPAGQTEAMTIDTAVRTIDLLPTLAALTETQLDQPASGLDLSGLWRGKTLPQRELFWANGVLSKDGKTRLFTTPLNDTAVFPERFFDAEGHSLQVSQSSGDGLRKSYQDWYRSAIMTATENKQSGNTLVMSGNDNLRTPGFGGFTMALPLAPTTAQLVSRSVLAGQDGVWSISTNNGNLALQLGGENFSLGTLTKDSCQSIVVSGKFWRRQTHWGDRDNYQLTIYREGKLFETYRMDGSIADHRSKPNPTIVGSEGGDWLFGEHIFKPLLLHADITRNKLVSAEILHKQLCVMSGGGQL
jgi:arylsulfatase A-like enzyme